MTRRKRTLLDAIADKLVELVDDYDVSRLFEPKPKKLPPVKLKATVVDATAEDVGKDVKP